MSDVSLEYLTVCGLFHDLGKVGVPREILHKEGALTGQEWEQIKTHPLLGVGQILKLNAPPSLRARILLGPFEHHLNPDMTGYPRTLFMHQLSLLGRILRIADTYEALTARRAYRARSYAPDQALRKMWREAGKSFDTILLKCFIQMMGVYPIGSLVELSDGGIALVMEYPDDARKMQPLVLKLENDGRGGFLRGEIIYLPDHLSSKSAEVLSVVRGLDPSRLGISVAQFFLCEK
jgi:HD-GYP domain-containing protein (c-di-GMP phosphodiesterase class II)